GCRAARGRPAGVRLAGPVLSSVLLVPPAVQHRVRAVGRVSRVVPVLLPVLLPLRVLVSLLVSVPLSVHTVSLLVPAGRLQLSGDVVPGVRLSTERSAGLSTAAPDVSRRSAWRHGVGGSELRDHAGHGGDL